MAYITCMRDPLTYFTDQAPNIGVRAADFSPQALGVTLQLGNVLLLLAAIGGALLVGAAGAARIAQLRLSMRRERQERTDS